jgi:hypothetical protein
MGRMGYAPAGDSTVGLMVPLDLANKVIRIPSPWSCSSPADCFQEYRSPRPHLPISLQPIVPPRGRGRGDVPSLPSLDPQKRGLRGCAPYRLRV